MSQVRGEGRGNGHSVFMLILPYVEQVAVYNAYNFWLENYDITNQTAVRARVPTFVCPDNPNIDDVAAIDVRFPDSRSTFAKNHYGANWGGGRGFRGEAGSGYRRTPAPGSSRGPWGEDFAKERGTYLGVMMTVANPDGQTKGADGQPRARNITVKDITDGASFTLAMVVQKPRQLPAFRAVGWHGGEASSTFMRRRTTTVTMAWRARSTADRPTQKDPTPSCATARSARCVPRWTGRSGLP